MYVGSSLLLILMEQKLLMSFLKKFKTKCRRGWIFLALMLPLKTLKIGKKVRIVDIIVLNN